MKALAGLLLVGCGVGSVHPEACPKERLAEITAWYQSSLAQKCVGQGLDCVAKPSIDAELHDRLKQWVRCEDAK